MPTAPSSRWRIWALRLGWLAGLFAFYALLLGEQTLDAIDEELPRRDRVCVGTGEAAIDHHGELDGRIAEALGCLPPGYLGQARELGARLVLSEESLAQSFPGIELDPVSELGGVYDPETRTLYVDRTKRTADKTALHELGHFLDHALGYASEAEPFAGIHAAAVERGELGRHLASSPRELFAESFARYHFSDRARAKLFDKDPRAAAYFRALDERFAAP
jgi:hypothetical protein